MENFEQLMIKAFRMGWYTGRKTLINLSMQGEFEGWTGRASEQWEHRFFITSDEIVSTRGDVVWPEINVEGKTLEEASIKALQALEIMEVTIDDEIWDLSESFADKLNSEVEQ